MFFCANVQAVLLESWENKGLATDSTTALWEKHASSSEGLTLSYSEKHATDGQSSLAIHTPGGWSRAACDGSDTTTLLNGASLRAALLNGQTVTMDVYSEKALVWARVSIAISAGERDWELAESIILRMGGMTSVKLNLTDKMRQILKSGDAPYRFNLIVNSGAAGNFYIDNLRVE